MDVIAIFVWGAGNGGPEMAASTIVKSKAMEGSHIRMPAPWLPGLRLSPLLIAVFSKQIRCWQMEKADEIAEGGRGKMQPNCK